jgi:putative transposase
MADAFISLFKAECTAPSDAPQECLEVAWRRRDRRGRVRRFFNHRRLHGEIGLMPPAELETNHWANKEAQNYPEAAVPTGAGSN